MKKFFMMFILAAAAFFNGCVSLEKMQKDADSGDEIAQVLLALKYFYGTGDVNMIQYDRAFKYFNDAAKKENPLACYYMGVMHEKGLGQTVVDYNLASAYYKRAAKTMDELPAVLRKNSYLAQAEMYDFGRGFKKSENHAAHFYEKAYNNENYGCGSALADFLVRTRGPLSAEQLKKILAPSLEAKEADAFYRYGAAIFKQERDKALEFMRKGADGNSPEAMIELGRLNRNNIMMRSAYEKAAAQGYAPAFYELALLEPAEEKRFDLLKKSADRGYVNAVEALGDYHESRKEWNLAVIYHLMADRMHGRKTPGPAYVRLERTLGTGSAAESIWGDRNYSSLADLGTNIDYFIRGEKAGIAKVRENYRKYIADDPDGSYVNMDYIRIYHAGLPLVMAGDIFNTYYKHHHGSVGMDFYLNYAICAGYAGQGAIQFYAAEKISLNRRHALKYHLAKLLLKANALALMGSSNDAYELLLAEYRPNLSETERNFMVDFVNGNCNMLLKDIKKLSAALNVPQEKFVLYKEVKSQPFYDLEKRTDSDKITVAEEPKIGKK